MRKFINWTVAPVTLALSLVLAGDAGSTEPSGENMCVVAA
jgi:hypothetical protein